MTDVIMRRVRKGNQSPGQYCPNCEAQAAEIEKLREREAELHGQLMRMIDRWEAQAARLAEADALIEKARSATVFDQSWNVDAYILVPQFDAYLGQST